MNKGENPTIMRFNRNAFVQSGTNTANAANLAPASPVITNPNISACPTPPLSAPKITPPTSATANSTASFNAANRLAQLRAEAMKSVNKTVVSQLGLKKQIIPDVIKVVPTPAAPVASDTATPSSSTISKAILAGIPDNLFVDNVSSPSGLSLTNSPSPRRRQDLPGTEPASRIIAKQAARLSALKNQKTAPIPTAPKITVAPVSAKPLAHSMKTTVTPSIETMSFPATSALISNPVDRKTDLATLARKISSDASAPVKDYKSVVKNDRVKKRAHKMTRKQKIIGALITSTVALGVGAWVVYLSVPDLAIKIAASSAGLDVAYPSTVVQGFVMSDVSSSTTGEITINYTNKTQSYTITQKKSSWDSDALLNNFIMPNWGGTYSVIREKGLTVYISSSRAAWVSGGVQHIIDATSAGFTNDQLRSIALSM